MRTPPLARRGAAAAALLAAALAAGAAPLASQDTTATDSVHLSTRYRATAIAGWQRFDRSAALRNAPFLGMRLGGRLTPMLAVGASATFTRPTTRGDYFPWNRQPYFSDQAHKNDTTLIFEVSQRVVMATYSADANVEVGAGSAGGRLGLGKVTLELGGGVGGYTFWLDPEQERANRNFSGFQFSLGGGLDVAAGRSATVGVRVDDLVLTDFDRERFSLSDPLLREDLFANPLPAPPAAKSTVHNLRLSLLFTFVPGPR